MLFDWIINIISILRNERRIRELINDLNVSSGKLREAIRKEE